MKWKYKNQGKRITISTVHIGAFKLTVHQYIGCGATWFTSCYGVFSKTRLGEVTLNEAQVMAAARLQLKLEETIKIITGGE